MTVLKNNVFFFLVYMKGVFTKLLLPERGNQSSIQLMPQLATGETSSVFGFLVSIIINKIN